MMEYGIRLSSAGIPEIRGACGWQLLDFNRMYAGYYPPCHFTAAATIRDAYYLAGTDGQSAVHLFCSGSGNVWEPVNLAPRDQPELPGQCGGVCAILENHVDSSVLLVCENGYVITLPGCPKCVKETHWNEKFAGGCIKGETLEIQCQGENTVAVPLAAVQQLRTGWTYAAAQTRAGGVIIDLRDEDATPKLMGAISENLPQAMLHLRQGRYSGKPVFFFCYTGAQADTAALAARKMGFPWVYSLGGVDQIVQTNSGVWPRESEG